MKKIIGFIVFAVMMTFSFTASAADSQEKLQVILGCADKIVAENFSGQDPLFFGQTFRSNNTTDIPGWGMVASGSEMSGIDVSGLGKKNYVIPLSDGQLKADVGISIKARNKQDRALLDVWNVPVSNINGADKYRFEYNMYISTNVESEGLIADVSTYAVDVPGATKTTGLVGFMRDGRIGICKKAFTSFEEVLDENGEPVRYENNAWQHIAIDINVKRGTFDFWLNDELIVTDAKPANTIAFNANEGFYRFRLAFTPDLTDAESFVVYDDVLFAKYVEEGAQIEFAHFQEKDDAINSGTGHLSTITDAIAFKNASGVKMEYIKLMEDGKEVKTKISEKNGFLLVHPANGFTENKTYSVLFNRFASTDGKTITKEDFSFSEYCHEIKLSTNLVDTKANVTIISNQNKRVNLIATRYNSDGNMIDIWKSEEITLKKNVPEVIEVPVDDFVSGNGENIQITVQEGLNMKPLGNSIVLQ